MMKKPKTHPTYGIELVGINFRERWNVVLHATKDEIELYVNNFLQIKEAKKNRRNNSMPWWEWKQSFANEQVQNIYLRKVWRKRYSETFQQQVLYKMDRTLERYNTKLGPKTENGVGSIYHFDNGRKYSLSSEDIVVLTKRDELGNLYFSKIDEITASNSYVFPRDSAQLAYIIPVEA